MSTWQYLNITQAAYLFVKRRYVVSVALTKPADVTYYRTSGMKGGELLFHAQAELQPSTFKAPVSKCRFRRVILTTCTSDSNVCGVALQAFGLRAASAQTAPTCSYPQATPSVRLSSQPDIGSMFPSARQPRQTPLSL